MPWSNLPSQPLVRDLLSRSLQCGRTHHAYLFLGEESDTETMALAFAQALNCEKSQNDFCGECESCTAIAKNAHPDLHVVRPESKSRRIVIDQIRDLEKAVYLKANRARKKVAVIHAADRLQTEAQDAFLKTLEEPPTNTVFLLLSEEAQQLKDTILSRCLRVPFLPSQKKEKEEREKQVEEWFQQFLTPTSNLPGLFRAYGFVGKVLELLKEVRDEKMKEAEGLLDDPSLDHLEKTQRERLEEQFVAQAQADYLRERTRFLRAMLEWYHANRGNPKGIEILENLARRLARNVNESLTWEVAMLELAELNH